MWSIVYNKDVKAYLHNEVKKYKARLNAKDRDRIDEAIANLEKEPPEGDIEPMTGQDGFRTRIGGYRILWCIDGNKILVTHLEPRGQAYTKKTRIKRGKK